MSFDHQEQFLSQPLDENVGNHDYENDLDGNQRALDKVDNAFPDMDDEENVRTAYFVLSFMWRNLSRNKKKLWMERTKFLNDRGG